MFIKYGAEDHLLELENEGKIFFNPCSYFRKQEEEQLKKGIGDTNDGGFLAKAKNVKLVNQDGDTKLIESADISLVVEPALKTPVFCLRKAKHEFISSEYYQKLKEQFPKHTHALIIQDEVAFKENLRFSFHNKAFAHSVFYQDSLFIDFIEFLRDCTSDIFFYKPEYKNRYYMLFNYFLDSDKTVARQIRIDDSNYYATMFRKALFFEDQFEYRFVLPYEQIAEGRKYQIEPFVAELRRIEDLVRDD